MPGSSRRVRAMSDELPPTGALRLARVVGVPVYLDRTWLLLGLFVAWTGLCFLMLITQNPIEGPAGPCPGFQGPTECDRALASPLVISVPAVLAIWMAGLALLLVVRAAASRSRR